MTPIAFDTGLLNILYPAYKARLPNATRIVSLVIFSDVDIGGMKTTFATSSGVTVSQFSTIPGTWPIPTTPTTTGSCENSSVGCLEALAAVGLWPPNGLLAANFNE